MNNRITSLGLCLLVALGLGAQTRKNWNFTLGWGTETLTNIEKNIDAGGDWTVESDGHYQIGDRITGELTVNVDGEDWVIPETQGLLFGATAAKHIVVAFNDNNGFAGNQFLWLNGSRSMDTFTVPAVAPGEKINIVYESHKTDQERGFKCTTDGVRIEGNDSTVQTTTIAIDTAVYVVPETFQDSTDVTFQLTNGIHIYRICVGNLYEEEVVAETYNVAYIYDASYPGYSADVDFVKSMALAAPYSRNTVITDINLAGDMTSVDTDSLMAFDCIVLSMFIAPDNQHAELLKSAVAYVPTLNLSSNLYPTWGYGTQVATNDEAVRIGAAAVNYELFNQTGILSNEPLVNEDSLMTMFDGGYVVGYDTLGSYFAEDSVIAVGATSGVKAIHIHNRLRNAYLLLPYSVEQMSKSHENMLCLIPNAVTLLSKTKRDIPQTIAPTFAMVNERQQTRVSISTITERSAIYYTTDGTEPTTESTLYTEPFLVFNQGTIVKAIAIGDGYYASETAQSQPVEVQDQVETPVISVKQENGLSTITVECATPGADIYYNFSGRNDIESSELLVGDIQLSAHASFSAFATCHGMVTSEVATQQVRVIGETLRLDTLAHMDGSSAYGSGDIVKAYSYYSTTEIRDEQGNVVTDEEGNIMYEAADSLTYVDYGNGWAVGSRGQRINRQSTPTIEPVATSYYGPLTVADYGASDGCVSFLTARGSNDPASAWMQTTVKYQAPFDIIVYMTSTNEGQLGSFLEVSVSEDSVNWTVVETLQTFAFKDFEKLRTSYEGTGEVYVKFSSANTADPLTQNNLIFDILLLAHGPLSEQAEAEITGVATPQAVGEAVSTAAYTLEGVPSGTLRRGVNIVKEFYANGAVKTKKVIRK